MRNILCLFIIFIGLFVLNSCSENNDISSCSLNENISMKINGDFKQFQIIGWGINLNNSNLGHTLHLQIFTGVLNPSQDSYEIILKLPYKKTGSNIIEEFNYFRIENGSSLEVNFVLGEFQSSVTVNNNTCFSATFSGSIIIDENEITITEGVFNHTYSNPFD